MKETSTIKERLIENMKEEYPLNVEYIKSYLPNYGLPVMGVFLSNGFPEYVNLEDGPKNVDQAVMYIDVESLKTILNATDEVSVSDAVFMDGIIRFLKYYRPVSLVYRKSGMTDGKVLLNILERLFEICPPIAPLQDIKAAASALIYERDDEAVRAASLKASIGSMIRQGTRQIAEKLYRLKGQKVYGKLSYTERPYLPDYDFVTIEKRYEDRPIDSLIIVETDGFLEKVNGYYKGEGGIGDLILVFSLLRTFVWDDAPIVEDEAESVSTVQEGTWKVPSDECSKQDVLKDIIKKSFDAKGIKVEELLENAKDYNTNNLIHSLTSDTKLSFKQFRELLKLTDLDFSLSVLDSEVPPKFYTIYSSSTDSTECTKMDSLIDNGARYKGFDDDYDENYDGFDGDDLSDDEEDEDDSDAEYVDCPVTMIVRIKKSDADNLERIENHIEEFIDLDSWPEIDSIYGVTVASPASPDDIANMYITNKDSEN